MKNNVALFVAIGLGVLGFASMQMLTGRPAAGGPGEGGVARVLVAQKELKAGTKIESGHLEVRDLPAAHATSMHIPESARAAVVGRVLRTAVRAGEPVLAPAIETGAPISAAEIEGQLRYPDTHAVAIALDAAGSIAGLLRPGQKVDVIGTFDRAGPRAALLLQNRTVLAIDTRSHSRWEADERKVADHVVTIAVTAEEALRIALLQAKGRAHLALRSRADGAISSAAPVSVEALAGAGAPQR